MRLVHTSDWHLGHTLRDLSREREHAAFLAWLLDQLDAEAADALLISGDVYDSSIPSAATEKQWFDFLAAARARRPAMAIVVIAGNHDSPSRLGATSALCRAIGAHVIAALPRGADGEVDVDGCVIDVGPALIAAVPHLRASELPVGVEPALGVRARVGQVLEAARRRRRPGQALVAMAHLYLVGAATAWLSERRTLIGGEEALTGELFGPDVAYVALGHIHKAQRIGRDGVRYAGSPLPLAIDEADYKHQIVVVELDGEQLAAVRAVPVPRTVDVVRIPRRGALPLAEALAAITALPAREPDDDPERRPYLEVVIAPTQPDPLLRAKVEDALEGRAVRLVKLTIERAGDGAVLADAWTGRALADLDPREVLARRWAQQHGGEVPAPVLAAFDRLLAEVTEADGGTR
ncbi:MAG: exonuclease SbcCD subunit D C-terminal domain-containing protein [Kofleriaceae bacterium]|nr:exonuclease SbcCD subunit D C-terminal domain-containing protein [Kofleriaceae bacterium]MBP6837498.1 exonuclease SbcCD subunit D C-terminal domain-containing protein [Kofleriaceae bacterium]